MAAPPPSSSTGTAPVAATLVIALGTLVSLAAGVIANKVYAVALGPSGVGVIALFLAVVSIGSLIASAGMWTSVAQALSVVGSSGRAVHLIEGSARRICLALSVGLVVGTVLLREQVATLLFGTSEAAPLLVVLSPAIGLTALAYVETGILTGRRRTTDIATVNGVTALLGAAFGAAAALTVGLSGIPLAVLAGTAIHYLVARLRVSASSPKRLSKGGWSAAVAIRLITLGSPAAISQLSAMATQVAIPVLILHEAGSHEVGLYRSASVISVAYLTLFLSTLTYEYLPRIAGLRREELGGAVDRHMRMLLAFGVPLILGLFALAPLVIPILFSERFTQASLILQWQLVGDLLRLPAWALAYALLARANGGLYLGLEVVLGLTLLVAVPTGLNTIGLEGVGMAYAVAQAVYLALAWIAARRAGVTAPGTLQAGVIALALAATASIIVDMPLLARGLGFGVVAAAIAAATLPRVLRTPEGLLRR